jgi:hypothetical protein
MKIRLGNNTDLKSSKWGADMENQELSTCFLSIVRDAGTNSLLRNPWLSNKLCRNIDFVIKYTRKNTFLNVNLNNLRPLQPGAIWASFLKLSDMLAWIFIIIMACLWLLKCSKKNPRKWTWKQEIKNKIFVFQPILDCITLLECWRIFFFKKWID